MARRARRLLIAGLLTMAAVSLAAPLLRQTGLSTMLYYLLVAVALIPLVGIGLSAAPKNALGASLGILVMILPPIVAAASIDVRLAGFVIEGPPGLVRIGWPSGYRFPDAIVRADLARAVTIIHRTRGGSWREELMIAPVVTQAWTAAEPVRVWAVAGDAAEQAEWSQPWSAGVRLLPRENRDKEIWYAANRPGIVATEEIITIRWVRDPADEILSAWLQLAAIVGIAGLLWVAILAIYRDRSGASGA